MYQVQSIICTKDSLDLHYFRIHMDPSKKSMVEKKTQTVWNMEEDSFTNISMSRITKGRSHTLPTKPVRITPPDLLLTNSDLSQFFQENKTEKDSKCKSWDVGSW